MSIAFVIAALAGWAEVEAQTHRYHLEQCAPIRPGAYETFMIFNRPGRHTYYKRSYCFQNAAISLRDEMLCDEVRERKSLLFDGSKISKQACRIAVAKQTEKDRDNADEILKRPFQGIASIDIRLNGNGHDLDIPIKTAGGEPGSYRLTVRTRRIGDGRWIEIDSQPRRVGADPQLFTLFFRTQELEERLGEDWQGETVTLEFEWRQTGGGNWAVQKLVAASAENSTQVKRFRYRDLPPPQPYVAE